MPSPLFIVLLVGLGIALVEAIRRLTQRRGTRDDWLAMLLLGGGIALTLMCILGRAIGLPNPMWLDIAATTLGCLAALVGFAMLEARSKRDR